MFGRYVKCIPRLNILIHYLVLLLIIIEWILIGSGQCDSSYSTDTGNSTNNLKDDAIITNAISSIAWAFLHIGGFFIRGCLYYEPFMYSPDPSDGSVFVTYLFKKCGP